MIVAGDSKQLPPSSWFKKDIDISVEFEDENIDTEEIKTKDLESLLDQCVVAAYPQCPLKWHYRSRHEHLIAFSNKYLYNNSLYTFSSPDSVNENLGVQFVEVKTLQEKINNKRIEEAKQIAKAVIENTKKHKDK